MAFHHYKLTIFLDPVEKPVEIDFYCFSSRLSSNVQRFLKRYDSNYINYYTIRSL